MWPDQVSNPGPLTYRSVAQPTAVRGLATHYVIIPLFKVEFRSICIIKHILNYVYGLLGLPVRLSSLGYQHHGRLPEYRC